MADLTNIPGFHYDPLKRDTLLDEQDPFLGSETQTHRMRAYCDIWVAGVNITDKLEPHLISVRVKDAGVTECEIEIDDRDAKLPLPPLQAAIEVYLGWSREELRNVFQGVISDFEHGFGRKQGGRRMWVRATGFDFLGTKIKEPMSNILGEGAPPGQKEGKLHGMPEWLEKIVKAGGGTAVIAGAFKDVLKDNWQMMQSSVMHEVEQLAEQNGAITQWAAGNKLHWETPGQRGLSVVAKWRDNLIGWRVRPFVARTAWGGSKTDTYDNKAGEWIQKIQQFLGKGPAALAQATGGGPGPTPSSTAADNTNKGAADGADTMFNGIGRIVINGEPAAIFNSFVLLVGARPGVDGLYLIHIAEHIYSRQGYITWLDVTVMQKAPDEQNVFMGWKLPRPNPNIR